MQYVTNEEDCIESLANAIVERAFDDYVRMLMKKKNLHNSGQPAKVNLAECERFFRSQWFSILTTVSSEYLMESARTKANWLMWRKQQGCNHCKRFHCKYHDKEDFMLYKEVENEANNQFDDCVHYHIH